MLTITIQPTSDGTTFKLDGKVVAPWVQNLERLWRHMRKKALQRTVRVDLTSVLHVDGDGTRMLKRMHEDGAELMGKDSVMKSVLEDGDKWDKANGDSLEAVGVKQKEVRK
jgi:ABC-type transporter Mla MlaB component